MRKRVIVLAVFWLFVVLTPLVTKADDSIKNTSESSLSRSFWDWLTTIGKSSQEKQRIKSLHKVERTQKRIQRQTVLREKERLREDESRIQEEQRIREARIRAKRRRIEQKKRQMEKVMREKERARAKEENGSE